MNGSPPPLPKALRRRPVSPVLVIFLILVAVAAFPLAWHVKWRIGNMRAVSRLERVARAGGEPLNFAELSATYPEVPSSSNAYTALEGIWELEDPDFWLAFNAGQRQLPKTRLENDPQEVSFLAGDRLKLVPTQRLNASCVQATAKFLESQREHMSLVREGLKRPEFRAPIVFADGAAALLPYLQKMKREGTLFRVEAGWAVEVGLPDQALESIGELARVGHCLRKDPFLIGQLVRLSVYSMAISSAERLLSREALSESQLENLAAVISSLQALDGYKRALLGERAMIFGFLDSPQRTFLLSQEPGQGESPEAAAQKSAFGMRLMGCLGMKSAEKRLMGEAFEQVIKRSGSLDFAANNQLDVIFENLDQQAKKFPPKIITAMMMPALNRLGDRFARAEALRLCAATAIRIELSRLRHGGIAPQKLDDLAGVVPVDPFNDQPLHYKRQSQSYLVYSVGPDRKDNDGLLEPPSKGPLPRESDIGFRVERPQLK